MILKRNPLGIDIGSGFLKVVQLREKRAGYELALFTMMPLEPDTIVEGAIANKGALVNSLREVMRMSGIKKGEAVIGVAGHSSVAARRLTMALMTEDEVSQTLKAELDQYIPFDTHEVRMDFHILGPHPSEEGQMEVLVAAVKDSVMDEYVDAVKQAGLQPLVVDLDAFALSNMYEVNYDVTATRNVALVNIGASSTNMVVLRSGVPIFMKDTPVGSSVHTAAIERAMHVSRKDAERLKQGFAVEKIMPEDVEEIVKAASDEIYAEIYRAFEFFRSTEGGEEINEIALCGGAALIKGFSDRMAERLRIPVKVADPFHKIGIPEKLDPDFIRDKAPAAAVAVGLALRRGDDRQ